MDPKSVELEEFLKKALDLIGIEAEIAITETEEGLRADLSGDELSALIGGRGKTLNALQCLVNVAINRGQDEWRRIVLDAAGYRERRRESLVKCAEKTAAKAVEEGREVSLEPMNSYERRIVHTTLLDNPNVKTTSCGEEPYRFIIVSPVTPEDP